MKIFSQKILLNFILWFLLSFGIAISTFHVLAATSNAPIVFNYSISGNSGDVIGLQGTKFSSNPQVFLSWLSSQEIKLAVVNKGNNYVAAQIPESMASGVLKIRVFNGTDYSSVVYLNRAKGTSFDTPEIAPGGKFRIFGRNLLLSGETPTVRFVNPTTAASLDAKVTTTNSDAYVLNVTAPAEITPGVSYDVYVSNGSGGVATETKVDTTILGRKGGNDKWKLDVAWTADYDFYNNVYNVKTDSRLSIHAAGDGVNDDQSAIQNAIDVATKAGGGVVFLPAGTYKLALATNKVGIAMATKVVIQGEGRDNTFIKYGYGQYPSSAGYVMIWPDGTSVAGIADLTIQNVNEQGRWDNTMLAGKVSEIFMQRIKLDMNSADSIYMGNMQKLAIENSIFNQTFNAKNHGPWILDGNEYLVIRGNTVTHSSGAYSVNNVSHGVIENNHFTRDGAYKTKFDVRNLNLNFATDIAILNNTFDVINGPIDINNDGETILSEGGGALRPDENIGTVSSAGTRTLQDSSKNWNSSSFSSKAIVAIVSGRGTGQWRKIVGVADNNIFKLDRPWDIVPEQNDHYITFAWSAANWIVKGNTLTDNPRGILLYNASSRDIAIVDNTLKNNGGIYLRTVQQVASDGNNGQNTAIFNVQILNNNVSNNSGLRGAFIGNISAHVSKETTFGVGVFGLEVRGNTLTAHTPNTQPNPAVDEVIFEGYNNIVRYQYTYAAPFKETEQPAILGAIFQSNQANNCDDTYQLSTGAYRTTIWKSLTNNTKELIKDDVFNSGASRASTGTVVKP